MRFVGDTVDSLWMFLSRPEKVVQGVGQLVRLAIVVQFAGKGITPAMAQTWLQRAGDLLGFFHFL